MASHKRRPVRALVTLTVAIVAACAALAIGHLAKGVSPYPDLALDLKGGTQPDPDPDPDVGGTACDHRGRHHAGNLDYS